MHFQKSFFVSVNITLSYSTCICIFLLPYRFELSVISAEIKDGSFHCHCAFFFNACMQMVSVSV